VAAANQPFGGAALDCPGSVIFSFDAMLKPTAIGPKLTAPSTVASGGTRRFCDSTRLHRAEEAGRVAGQRTAARVGAGVPSPAHSFAWSA